MMDNYIENYLDVKKPLAGGNWDKEPTKKEFDILKHFENLKEGDK